MTGAGSGSLAFGKEDTFMGSLTGGPDYWQFGRDEDITELSLDNQIERLREAEAVESVESVRQNFEGAVGISAVVSSDTFGDVEDLVFNDGGAGFVPGRPQSAKIYAGVDYLDGTTERALEGCIPTDFALSYEQGGLVRFSVSFIYATETPGTSITPASVTAVSSGTSAAFHDFSLDVDGATVTKLQSAELSISNISRFQYGATGPTPVDAVIAAPETELTTEAIYTGPSRLELALGSSDATAPEDRITPTTASLDLNVDGTAVSSYDLGDVKPATQSWADVIGEADTTESITFNADGGVTVA